MQRETKHDVMKGFLFIRESYNREGTRTVATNGIGASMGCKGMCIWLSCAYWMYRIHSVGNPCPSLALEVSRFGLPLPRPTDCLPGKGFEALLIRWDSVYRSSQTATSRRDLVKPDSELRTLKREYPNSNWLHWESN